MFLGLIVLVLGAICVLPAVSTLVGQGWREFALNSLGSLTLSSAALVMVTSSAGSFSKRDEIRRVRAVNERNPRVRFEKPRGAVAVSIPFVAVEVAFEQFEAKASSKNFGGLVRVGDVPETITMRVDNPDTYRELQAALDGIPGFKAIGADAVR